MCSFKMKKGFTPLETIGRQRKGMVSLTGFTLVEILIALLILGSGMVISFNLFVLGWQSLSYSRKLNEVAYLAQTKLEELKSQKDTIKMGETSGKEKGMTWIINAQPQGSTLEIIQVELNIEFDLQAKPQRHKFVTYFFKET